MFGSRSVVVLVAIFGLLSQSCEKDGVAPGGNVNCGPVYGQSTCALNLVGKVTTVAGSGTAAEADGVGAAASFSSPLGLTTDGTNLYVIDNVGQTVRKIVIATSVVTTLAGSGATGEVDGTGTAAQFHGPAGIVLNGGNLFISDYFTSVLRKVVIATGVVTTFAGSGAGAETDGTGTAAAFNGIAGIATDGANLYIADAVGRTIRKVVVATAVVTTLAGSGVSGSADGTGTAATFNRPIGLACDGANLFVTDQNANVVRKIVIATRVVTTVAGSGAAADADGTGAAAAFNAPVGITSDGTNLFISELSGNKIRKLVAATGVVTTVAGSGSAADTDGTGTAAAFNQPYAFTSDGASLFVGEYGGNKVRKIQ